MALPRQTRCPTSRLHTGWNCFSLLWFYFSVLFSEGHHTHLHVMMMSNRKEWSVSLQLPGFQFGFSKYWKCSYSQESGFFSDSTWQVQNNSPSCSPDPHVHLSFRFTSDKCDLRPAKRSSQALSHPDKNLKHLSVAQRFDHMAVLSIWIENTLFKNTIKYDTLTFISPG